MQGSVWGVFDGVKRGGASSGRAAAEKGVRVGDLLLSWQQKSNARFG